MVKPAAAAVALLCFFACSSTAAVVKFERLNVDLFVMSKCPDAFEVQSVLAPVLQELKGILSINWHIVGEKKDDGTFTCKHGSSECAGNIQQLCVQQHSKPHRRYDWLFKFVLCSSNQGMDEVGTDKAAATCLKEVGVPAAAAAKMTACMDGPGRDDMLQQDMRNTAALGVLKSATIQMEGKTICIHDGGEWKDCPGGTEPENFKEIFCASFAAKNNGRVPAICRPPRSTPLPGK